MIYVTLLPPITNFYVPFSYNPNHSTSSHTRYHANGELLRWLHEQAANQIYKQNDFENMKLSLRK